MSKLSGDHLDDKISRPAASELRVVRLSSLTAQCWSRLFNLTVVVDQTKLWAAAKLKIIMPIFFYVSGTHLCDTVKFQ